VSVYRGEWSSYEDMLGELVKGEYSYERREYLPRIVPANFPREDEVLFATYNTEPYEGHATIVFRRDGVLLEWGDGHCSCNGLEWGVPSPTTEERLATLLSGER
jgi:hypothetical protein